MLPDEGTPAGRNAALLGGDWVPGIKGSALQFDGASPIADIGRPMPAALYRLDPTGGSTSDASCDMTRDGGGWTLVACMGSGTGNFAEKLCDATINLITDPVAIAPGIRYETQSGFKYGRDDLPRFSDHLLQRPELDPRLHLPGDR